MSSKITQVQHFESCISPNHLVNRINNWLHENPTFEVVSISYAITATKLHNVGYECIVLYTKPSIIPKHTLNQADFMN